jgi:hypothetical protein
LFIPTWCAKRTRFQGVEMSQIVESVKKYWPWGVGILGAVWLLTRVQSGGGGGADSYAAAAAQQQALQLEAAKVNAQLGVMQMDAQTRQYSAATAGQAQLLAAQGQTAMGVGSAAAAITQQLQAPTIAAIQAAAAENMAALQTAGAVSAASFQSIGAMGLAGGIATSGIAQGLGQQASAFSGGLGSSVGSIGAQQGSLQSPVGDNSAQWQAIGSIATGALALFSDKRIKTDIETAGDISSEIIRRLSFVSYKYVSGVPVTLGLIAQDVEELGPHLVAHDTATGLKVLDLSGLLMMALQSIQTLQQRVDELERSQP